MISFLASLLKSCQSKKEKKKEEKIMKKFLAIFLTTLLLVIPMVTIVASATSYNQESNEKKITDELKAEMENKKNNEYISIYIWLYDLGESSVYNELSNHYGEVIDRNNEELFLQKRINEKVEKYNLIQNSSTSIVENGEKLKNESQVLERFNSIRNNSIVNDTITDDDLKRFIESGKDIKEIVTKSEQNAYLKEWRKERKNLNSKINNTFKNFLDLSKCKNINIDSMLGYIVLESKNSYIEKISSLPLVREIGLYNKEETEKYFLQVEEEDETEEYLGYHMLQSQLPSEFTGLGINVGVLELFEGNRAYYDTENVHLMNKTNQIETRIDPTINLNSVSSLPSMHATHVLAILVGDPVQSVDGDWYQGIAPEANVFYTCVDDEGESIRSGLEWLVVEKNVSVINVSVADDAHIGYNETTVFIDCLIEQYRVTIVAAAGNDGSATARIANCYNVISVGNLTSQTNEAGDYIMSDNSSFLDLENTTNKPDIVAFGTNIYTLDENYQPSCFYKNGNAVVSGTSFSTPLVTGTIALMMEASLYLRMNPHLVKSILLTSSDDEHVDTNDVNNALRCQTIDFSTNYLNFSNPIVRTKTGAGILNIKAAVENARQPVAYSFVFTSNGSKATNEIFISSYMHFKVGLVFEKADHDLIGTNNPLYTNINLEMIDINTGAVVFSSVANEANSPSRYDNVKVFDVSTKVSGTYVFRVTCSGIDISDETGTNVPDIHQTSHEKINVALSITCSCLNPTRDLETVPYTNESSAELYSCDSFGCMHVLLTDITYYDELTWTESFATIFYTVTHKRSYSNEIIITDVDFDYYITLNDSSKTYQARYTHGNIETVSYGYLDRYYFEIYVYDSMGRMEYFETAVEVEYVNTFDRVYIYPIMLN